MYGALFRDALEASTFRAMLDAQPPDEIPFEDMCIGCNHDVRAGFMIE
jgi:hypothetical protein